MSIFEDFRGALVDKVLYLTQEEGLKDHEVAEILGVSRATVNRTRKSHNIPTANLRNRKDKECLCDACGKAFTIQRKERRKRECAICSEFK